MANYQAIKTTIMFNKNLEKRIEVLEEAHAALEKLVVMMGATEIMRMLETSRDAKKAPCGLKKGGTPAKKRGRKSVKKK